MSRGGDFFRRWGARALLLAFFLGGLTALETRFQSMRLRSLTLSPPNPSMEKVLFDRLPFLARRFWPVTVLRFRSCQKELEDRFPVRVRPRISGWGRVQFSYRPRDPFIRVRWQDGNYTLTREGKIWPVSHDLEAQQAQTGLPLLEWDRALTPAVIEDEEKVVHDTGLPLESIRQWLEAFGSSQWFHQPLHFKASKKIGGIVLEINLKIKGTEVSVFLPEDPRRWPQLFKALDVILAGLSGQEKWVRIDATYSDKIVVKRDTL